MRVTYRTDLPYPPVRVLSQYFDLEHIRRFHPHTIGEAHLVAQHGSRVIWQLVWPPLIGDRFRSLVEPR